MTTMRLSMNSNTKYCILFLLCILSSIIRTFQEEVSAAYLWIAIELIAYAITLISVLINGRSKHIIFRFFRNHPIIIFLYIMAYLQVLLGISFGYNKFDMRTLRFLMLWALYLLTGYTFTCFNNRSLNSVIKIFVIIGIFNAIYSLWEAYTYTNVFRAFYSRYYTSINYYRTSAAFVHPIPFSTMLIILLWITVYTQKEKKRKNITLIFIIVFAIIFTRSRSAWFALGLTSILWVISQLYRNNKLTLKRFCLIVGVILALVSAYFLIPSLRSILEMIVVRFSDINGSVSQMQRLGAISYVMKDFFNSFNPLFILFGKGTGSVNTLMSKTVIQMANFSTTDNQLLTIIYEYGIITFLALVCMIARMIEQIFVTRHREVYYFNLALIGFWICSFFFESLTWDNVSCIALFLTGAWLRYQERDYKTLSNKIEVFRQKSIKLVSNQYLEGEERGRI